MRVRRAPTRSPPLYRGHRPTLVASKMFNTTENIVAGSAARTPTPTPHFFSHGHSLVHPGLNGEHGPDLRVESCPWAILLSLVSGGLRNQPGGPSRAWRHDSRSAGPRRAPTWETVEFVRMQVACSAAQLLVGAAAHGGRCAGGSPRRPYHVITSLHHFLFATAPASDPTASSHANVSIHWQALYPSESTSAMFNSPMRPPLPRRVHPLENPRPAARFPPSWPYH